MSRLALDMFSTVHGHGGHLNNTDPSSSSSSVSIPPPSSSPLPTNPTCSGGASAAKEKNDGNIYFECTNCQKKVSGLGYHDRSTDNNSIRLPRIGMLHISAGAWASALDREGGLHVMQLRGTSRIIYYSIAAVSNRSATRLGAEADRGASPLVGSDYSSPAYETVNGKGKSKSKSKSKKINGLIYPLSLFISPNIVLQGKLLMLR